MLVESIIGSESDKITGHYTKITDYEKGLFGTLQYFVMGNHPLSDIEDPEYREISKFSKLYSSKMCKDVLKEISTIVEEKISEEMIEAKMKGLLTDGWTKSGTHFLGIFAVYPRKEKNVPSQAKRLNRHIYSKANKNCRGEEIKITMVSCSPLYSVDVKDTEQTPIEDELDIAT